MSLDLSLIFNFVLEREGVFGGVLMMNRNANETFDAYKSAAAKAQMNVPAANIQGGSFGSLPAAVAVAPPI